MSPFATVLRKEIADASRDRRTWITALASALLFGPGIVLLIAAFVSDVETRSARREIVVAQRANGPTLVNFLERSGARIVEAPPDFAARIASGELRSAVVAIPADFEARLASGDPAPLQLVYDGTSNPARGTIEASARLLDGFARELALQRMLARGVAAPALSPLRVDRRDLASTRAHGVELLFIIPWAVLMIAAVAALPMAIDVGAGERERGSLEPLLTMPVDAIEIVAGKWLAVTVAAIVVESAMLAAYVVTLRLVSDDRLAALLQFGPREALTCLLVLVPFAAFMSALLMLVGTWGRTFREAQTYASQVVLIVNLVPLLRFFLDARDAAWQLAVPVLGQLVVMMRVLRGEAPGAAGILVPALICAGGTLACLAAQRRLLQSERIVFGRG
ncbi:MAG TPA: ABC transporter permease subunit [Burkholderiaceae bacterium]|nr:ABC transporter permease subunit [Burkholderiaceae bacterium]